jgi:hypothetical protein
LRESGQAAMPAGVRDKKVKAGGFIDNTAGI